MDYCNWCLKNRCLRPPLDITCIHISQFLHRHRLKTDVYWQISSSDYKKILSVQTVQYNNSAAKYPAFGQNNWAKYPALGKKFSSISQTISLKNTLVNSLSLLNSISHKPSRRSIFSDHLRSSFIRNDLIFLFPMVFYTIYTEKPFVSIPILSNPSFYSFQFDLY